MVTLFFAVVLFIFALPLLMFLYAKKQYLAIRTMRGGWWKALAWLPIAPVGYLLVYFIIPGIMNPGNLAPIAIIILAVVADFALLLALLFLSLLSIAYGASRRDQNIPPGDRLMHRAAEIRKAVAWAVGVAAFVVLALITAHPFFRSPDPRFQRDAYDCNQSGDLDRRIDACTRIIGRGGGTENCRATAPCSQRKLASAYNNRGAAYDDKGDHDRAIADHKEAIRLDPKNALLTNALLILHSFTGGADDGANPQTGLIFDGNGALYGTTGSVSKAGMVFKLTPPAAGQTQWTETMLIKGIFPASRLIFDGNGALYGTTYFGGSSNIGTVFKLTPPAAGQTQWTHTVLHSFTGGIGQPGPSHVNPNDLIFDGNGALYGTTEFGGNSNEGTVYKLTPPAAGQTQWTETVLHSFTGGTDGSLPDGGLIFDGNGALYGTTTGGGSSGTGMVFKLTPPAAGQTQWTHTVLHRFTGGTGGEAPHGTLIFDRDGALYGITELGGRALSRFSFDTGDGTVFKLTPPAAGQTQWTHTVLHSFTGENGDKKPGAGLIFDGDGALYGTTEGNWFGGTVFKLTPPAAGQTQWTETVLHSFTGGRDGSYPHAGSLIFDGNGALYGTTVFGGNSDEGTVYKLTVSKH